MDTDDGRRAASSSTPPEDVKRAVESHVRSHAAEWFPGAGRHPTLVVRMLGRRRPGAALYGVHIGGSDTPQLVAKTRLSELRTVGSPRAGERPRLVPDTVPVAQQTAWEYSGLEATFELFGHRSDGPFSAVRPYDYLAPQNTILMEYVEGQTLRQLLADRSRLVWPPHLRPADEAGVWTAAGCWLRAFQAALPLQDLPARQSSRDDVLERFEAYGAFLADRLGPTARRLVSEAGWLAGQLLPTTLPMSVNHGDFAPRNLLLRPDQRLAVIDPMPRWAAPAFEDVCRLLVGIRLAGLQVHSHGWAYAAEEVERREADVIAGYLAGQGASLPQLRCYQLLVMLDKWATLVDTKPRNRASRLRARSVALATSFLVEQGQRLLELTVLAAESAEARPGRGS